MKKTFDLDCQDIGPGYDCGYRSCRNFWGTAPSSLVEQAVMMIQGNLAIDVGCGEGKNSFFLAHRGYTVSAIDASKHALNNAQFSYGNETQINWHCREAVEFLTDEDRSFDICVCTGLAHCLQSHKIVFRLLSLLGKVVTTGGVLAFSSFNDTLQDLSGHEPEFSPVLIGHHDFISGIERAGFKIIAASNEILDDFHPHIKIPHQHSISRILARKSSDMQTFRN